MDTDSHRIALLLFCLDALQHQRGEAHDHLKPRQILKNVYKKDGGVPYREGVALPMFITGGLDGLFYVKQYNKDIASLCNSSHTM